MLEKFYRDELEKLLGVLFSDSLKGGEAMSETGLVKELDEKTNLITIEFKAKGACKGCGICLVGSGADVSLMQIKTINTLNAKVGERVEFEVKDGATLMASLKLYAFPLGMLLLGFVLGQSVAKALNRSQDLGGLFFAFLFFGGAFYFLTKLESKKEAVGSHIQLLKIL
ncbi:MAG: SoxR reducing system RseC family protein [Candidatus Margulisbacteria bacterium]|nr:SoxR reducing system RseC family protein [Candidatus Margulisiibacteriota bacterium]